jgi:hypothetical protein
MRRCSISTSSRRNHSSRSTTASSSSSKMALVGLGLVDMQQEALLVAGAVLQLARWARLSS